MTTTTTGSTNSGDWTGIGLLRIVVMMAMAAASVFFVASLVAAVGGDSLASPLELGLRPDAITSPFPESATITEANAKVDVEAALGSRLAWWTVTDALALVGVAFLELLRRILAKGTDPFVEANAARLRWMAVLTLVFAFVGMFRGVVALAIEDAAGFTDLEATWDLRALGLGLVLIALLEVWRHGINLRNEQELTI